MTAAKLNWMIWVAVGALSLGLTFFLLRETRDAPASTLVEDIAATTKQSTEVPLVFGQVAEAERHNAAVSVGTERAIAVLRQALAQAQAQQPPDLELIAKLERELDRKTHVLPAVTSQPR